MAGRPLLSTGLRRSIGDGVTTRIWKDPWIPFDEPTTVSATTPGGLEVERVCELMTEGGTNWDNDKIKTLFDEETCQRIISIPPNGDQGGDKWVWELDRSGVYSVKSGYRSAMVETWNQLSHNEELDQDAVFRFWKRLWKLSILSRYKVFLWRACLGIIPAIESLEKRGMNINEDCGICNVAPEDVFHALIDCSDLQNLWIAASFDYSSRHYHGDLLEWLVVESEKWKEEQLSSLAVMLYYIWERRNRKKFENEMIRVDDIWPRVQRSMDEMQVALIDDGRNVVVPSVLGWEKPEYPFHKLNVDAPTMTEGGGVMGGLVRDGEGCILGVFMCAVYYPHDPILLEALAVKRGLELAREIGSQNIIIEGDAKLVFDMLKTNCNQASALNAISADAISKKAKLVRQDFVWTDSVPLFLSEDFFH
ncbi:ribonuclease H [Senna tora]|uniref:Ribonuclease H n=1 Tax=Senna tora TaxID=362788 RepID=A0A834T813_9FABA|nr:ribonuclease H [Senna tora]